MFAECRIVPAMSRRGRPAGLLANPDAASLALSERPATPAAKQVDVARRLGLSTAHLSEVLAGRKGIARDDAQRLADELGLPVGALFPELATFRVEVRRFVATAAEAVA